MKSAIKIPLSLICCILIYFAAWYSWGNYTRSYIIKTINNKFFISNTTFTFDKISLSGFPFNLNFNIHNLKSTTRQNTVIEFPDISIETSILMQKVNINFGNTFKVLQKTHSPLLVKFQNGVSISTKLYSSPITLLATSSKFNLTDIATMTYTDYGYSVIDLHSNEKLFISNHNLIKMQSFFNSTNDFNIRVNSTLNGLGSIYLENKKIRGENFLNADVIFSSNYNRDMDINNMTLNFIKFTLSSDHYIFNILGHMNFKKHYGFNGQIDVSITDLPEFFDSLSVFLKEQTINKWINILKAMNQEKAVNPIDNPEAQPNHNVSFRITGDNNHIVWGRLQDHTLTKMLIR